MVGFLLLLPYHISAQSTVKFPWQNSFIDYQLVIKIAKVAKVAATHEQVARFRATDFPWQTFVLRHGIFLLFRAGVITKSICKNLTKYIWIISLSVVYL